MKTKKTKRLLVVITFLVLPLLVFPSQATQHTTPSASLTPPSHSPFPFTTVNDTVVFQVEVQDEGNTVDNVTIHYNYLNQSYADLMQQNESFSNIYTYTRNFTQPGDVEYYMDLYSDNSLVDTTERNHFTVNDDQTDRISFIIEENTPVIFSEGNYSVNTPDSRLTLNFSLKSGLNLTIDTVTLVKEPIANYKVIGEVYHIKANSTEDISDITLELEYTEEELSELGTSPEFLSIQKRDNSSSAWYKVNSTLNQQNMRLVAEPESFSQWTITVESPYLQFNEVSDNINASVNNQIEIMTKITNIGGSRAENVTVKLIKPSSLITSNTSLSISIENLEPLENRTLTWIFTAQEAAEYNMVAVVESSNSEGDIREIRLNVFDDTMDTADTDNSPDTATNEDTGNNSIYFLAQILLTSYFVSRIIGKRK